MRYHGTVRPEKPEAGDVYYDFAQDQPLYYDGTTWLAMGITTMKDLELSPSRTEYLIQEEP